VFRLPLLNGPAPTRWELAAEAIAVKIRWFGLVLGYAYANFGSAADPLPLNAILSLGFGFTALATYSYWHGRIFLGGHPLLISCLEALFIGLLCHTDGGLDSPFRFYYLLSLTCAAIRHTPAVTAATCALDCVSFGVLFLALPPGKRNVLGFVLMLVVLAWVTWAAAALARLLKRVTAELTDLNQQLEGRIEERTRELQETQAQVLHQEKMAAFGLLAAGIAHEVGNPLTSISTVVQLLERRGTDEYTRERLGLVTAQLARIQATLRELVTFSRPAAADRGRVCLREIVTEALGIAKYYKGIKTREVSADVPDDLPPLVGVRDRLVQVFFNLVLNAVDATTKGGKVAIAARAEPGSVVVTVADDGHGIAPADRARVFRPYFTTKRHGTGLGLFVTQKLVHEHGGTVTFDSTPEIGTTFRIVFPVSGAVGAPY
jgi:signal transduction histidine kinase